MAKKPMTLSVSDIILHADASTIQDALESRIKIDVLLQEREEAYKKIVAIENAVEELVGEEGLFIYPAPPAPVAGFSKLTPIARPKPIKSKPETITEPEKTEPEIEPEKEDTETTEETSNTEIEQETTD